MTPMVVTLIVTLVLKHIRTNIVLLKGSLVLIAKSANEYTYIRTNGTISNLVELETLRAMKLVLI